MTRKRNFLIGSSLIALIIGCGVGQSALEDAVEESTATDRWFRYSKSTRCGRRTCPTTG